VVSLRRSAFCGVLVSAFLAASAPAASAHAILLRTQPGPQTTVPQAPTDVRLEFSESVEAAFGAIRVFDVDGHRVDQGSIRSEPGRRAVLIAVPHLKDGTYTVTWRVISADGHPVHGGFQFYVGGPSSISPVVVAGDRGAGRFIGWGYGAVRFAWFAALAVLTGMVTMRRWVWTPALDAAGLRDSPATEAFRRRFARALPAVWAVLLLTWGLTLAFQGAVVSGLSLWSAARPSVFAEVLRTGFGHAWLAGLGYTLAAAAPVFGLSRRDGLLGWSPSTWIAALGAAVIGLCVAAGLSGHASTEGNTWVGVPALAVHLLAMAVWVGGLAVLVTLVLRGNGLSPEERPRLLRQLVPRFSRVAIGAVAVLVATGTVNTILELASVSDLWRTTYGQVLTAKIVALAVALGFGARHLRIVPRRLAETDMGRASGAARSFRRTTAAELAVLAVGVALAAGLVVLVPGRSLSLAAQGPVNQERKVGGYTIQVFIDPSTVGDNQVHVTFVNAQGLGAADVTGTDVALGQEGSSLAPVAMRLISAGHFVGDAPLPAPGYYRLSVAAPPGSNGGGTTTFRFHLRSPKS
jgi:copper transport protein